jgi:response regulator of citrate/malate metabolism
LSVIVFSGPDSREMVAEAKRLGVTDVVEKPILLARLGQALAQLKQR